MSTDNTEDVDGHETPNAADPDHPLATWLGLGVMLAVLVIILDFFDVGYFDRAGPGAGLIIFGLGLFALVLEGLHTGNLPTARSFISRQDSVPIFWISLATYALAGTVMCVVGLLMILGPLDPLK